MALEWPNLPFTGAFRFHYVDREGQPSNRTVDAKSLVQTPDGPVLFGICRARRANRTFYLGRCSHMVDAVTGEAIADPTHDLPAMWQISPVGQAHAAVSKLDTEISALLFLARSTGRLNSNMSAAITDWLATQYPRADRTETLRLVKSRPEISQTQWRRALRDLRKADARRRQAFVDAVGRLLTGRRKNGPVTEALKNEALKVG